MLGFFRSQFVAVGLLAILLLPSQFLGAQTAPELEQSKQSVIVFDFNAEQARSLALQFGTEEKEIDSLPMEGIFEGVKASEIKNVSGSFSLPDKVEELIALGMGGDLPLEFYVQFEFTNVDACRMLTENVEAGSVETEIDGKKYWMPDENADAPKGMLGKKVSELIFEFGTKDYLTRGNREFLTPKLSEAWKKLPTETIRIAMDLETPSAFITEAIEMSMEEAPVEVQAYLELIDNVKSISLSAGMNTDNLFVMEAVGKDAEQAEEFHSGLDSLLGTAKMGGQFGVAEIAKDLPKEADVLKKVLNSLNAKLDKDVISVVIPKPEGFENAVKKMSELAQSEAAKMAELNDFRQLALAVHNYESAYQKFPFDAEEGALGWRVKILPFLEESNLFDKFDTDEGIEHETNAKLADEMPEIFGKGGESSNVARIVSDVNGFGQITDGSSNTIMLIEYPKGEPWLSNGGLSIDDAVELVAGLNDGEELKVSFFDGSCRRISNKVDKETLRNLFDPADGNVVDNFDF